MKQERLWLILGATVVASSLALAGCSDDDDGGGSSGTGGTAGAAASGGSGGGTGGSAGSTGGAGGSAGSTGGSAGSTGGSAGAGGGLQTGQVDRMGRPAIATALIPTDKKDDYNKAAQATWSTYATDMQASLEVVDNLDGDKTNGLLASNRAALAALLADDQLQIDIAIDDCDGGYLALELQTPNKCGGRSLDEDIVDKTLQALVDASGTTTVTDAIDSNDKAFSDAFPYVAAPH